MNIVAWTYHKIRVWLLWRVLGIISPSVALYGISHPLMFPGAGNFRDHRYAGVTPQQYADYDVILRRAMNGAQR